MMLTSSGVTFMGTGIVGSETLGRTAGNSFCACGTGTYWGSMKELMCRGSLLAA